MNRYDIVIDKISSDRQHCIDSHGKKYSIANIEELSKHQSLNVYTRKNTSGNKYSKIIVHKPRCNPKTLKVRLKSNGGKVLQIKQSDVKKKGTLTGNGVVIEQKDIIRNNTYKDNTVTISEHKYNMASKISKELYVVTEDRGTTINIIAQILRLFAYDKNINLKCTYLGCHGNSYMLSLIHI